MINKKLLKGKMAENGLTQKDMAKLLHMDPKTFGHRMKLGDFWSSEIYAMAHILGIENVKEIFFADKLA